MNGHSCHFIFTCFQVIKNLLSSYQDEKIVSKKGRVVKSPLIAHMYKNHYPQFPLPRGCPRASE